MAPSSEQMEDGSWNRRPGRRASIHPSAGPDSPRLTANKEGGFQGKGSGVGAERSW